MISIDNAAVSVAHSLVRQYGRSALSECDKRILAAEIGMDRPRMAYWVSARAHLRSGQDMRVSV